MPQAGLSSSPCHVPWQQTMYKFRRVQDDIFERIENCTEVPMALTVG